MNRIWRAILVILLVSAIGFPIYWQLTWVDSEGLERYERAETELVVANLANATLTLYRSGNTLADTTRIREFDGKRIWLKPGNYFIRSDDGQTTSYFPVPLSGFRSGPDDDGTFQVTVRPFAAELPPHITDHSSFAFIPSGNFLLGDKQNPREPHYVWLTGYFISPSEVTNEEFREFLHAPDGYDDRANWTLQGNSWKVGMPSRTSALLKPSEHDYIRFGQPDQPVVWVTWYEARAYCSWLSRRFASRKWQFSLPTDAEWEKVARGPDNFDYALGMFISDAEVQLYNWRKNPDAPVTVVGRAGAQYRSNRYGVFHLTGNVAEWTQSIQSPYSKEHPYTDDDRNYDDTPGLRTVRGGSWYSEATSYLYTPYRDSFQPEHRTQDVGFRIVAKKLP